MSFSGFVGRDEAVQRTVARGDRERPVVVAGALGRGELAAERVRLGGLGRTFFSARLCTRFVRASTEPVRASMTTLKPSASLALTTIDSNAGTRPERMVGNATALTRLRLTEAADRQLGPAARVLGRLDVRGRVAVEADGVGRPQPGLDA